MICDISTQHFTEYHGAGTPTSVCLSDDIFVTGKIEAEHHRNLKEVLIRTSKCENEGSFMVSSVEYIGCKIQPRDSNPQMKGFEPLRRPQLPKVCHSSMSFLGL